MTKGLLLAIVFTALAACNYNRVKDGAEDPARGPGGAGAMSAGPLEYKTVLTAVIGPRCLGCHSSAAGNQGGLNIETYQALKAHLSRVAYRSLEKRDMPAGGLSPAQTQLLQAWIDAGAPEFDGGPVLGKPDPELSQGPTDWPKVRDKIFGAKCMTCHDPSNPGGGLDLSSLPMVRAKATVIFERVVVRRDMPLSPYPGLNDKEMGVLMQWFGKGMPE